MYGDTALKLITNAKRAQALDTLPPYEEEIVRSVVREINELDDSATQEQLNFDAADPESTRAASCRLFVLHLCMRRNKRCLLAYEKSRAERIADMVWAGSNDLAEVGDAANNLSVAEQEYMRRYNDLVAEFKGPFTDVDLSGSLEPPKDVFIDVRVLKDAGEIQTEYGVFNLTKNSQFFVRQADVQRLIQQGYLQRL